jgi:hypothetical protein
MPKTVQMDVRGGFADVRRASITRPGASGEDLIGPNSRGLAVFDCFTASCAQGYEAAPTPTWEWALQGKTRATGTLNAGTRNAV